MTDLEKIKIDVKDIDSRANTCWYDIKILAKAVLLILKELTADRKDEPPTADELGDCNICRKVGSHQCCYCINGSMWERKVEDEPQTDCQW